MDYNQFVNYSNNNIDFYKYIGDFDNNDIELFYECYNNWYEISQDTYKLLRDKIAKITDNNIMVSGYLMHDRIYFKHNEKNIHCYIVFINNIIELWYIIGNISDIVYNINFRNLTRL
tara:strand:- start:1247 stop:1597 length:351 start_codon:yes stop_codon:yes gene_type:complete